ncbi:MAG: hypothetical protein CME59_20585 [Halioglobus sp.]|nr:hypothetical protein [Halioglobus sp.]|tara:strand:- start:5948 stop:6748 length:801 start_codon:yes stop_codon:yes gene_type:complete
MELVDHTKPLIEDKEFVADVIEEDFSQKSFNRVFALKKVFTDVSFKQSEISNCYFRNCRFIRCDFTGANIARSNFRGAQYEECKFHYSTWEHTILDEEFLDNCLPSEDSLARDLARSLRTNFSQIGNYQAVNKAASIEVAMTGLHFFNAAFSKQSYYRSKYKGWRRILHVLRYTKWKALDLLWGNGESLLRIIASGIFAVLVCSLVLAWREPIFPWSDVFGLVATAFWGVETTPPLPGHFLAMLTAIRFVLFGLFMAILVKRLSRR